MKKLWQLDFFGERPRPWRTPSPSRHGGFFRVLTPFHRRLANAAKLVAPFEPLDGPLLLRATFFLSDRRISPASCITPSGPTATIWKRAWATCCRKRAW